MAGYFRSWKLTPPGFVDLAVHARDLAEPDVTFFVLHVEDIVD
jgi:hypothetical protein